jgi:wobble nucleotide-excising tRNase
MIKKFIKICGTGKFLNYTNNTVSSNHKTTDFEKINLIYGENGSGKTTLSVILNSLKGDNELLLKKRSFDRTIPQNIEVLTDVVANQKLTFKNNAWDAHYQNIEIFDIHFIFDNIYTGSEIQTAHKKNLFEVIFGQQGISLKLDIQTIKDRIQNGNKLIKETSEKIELAIDKAYTAENFCKMQADTLIDTKIAAKEADISTAKSYQLIQQKTSLSLIPLLSLPFDIQNGIITIEKSIDNISEQFLLKFKAHKDHLEMEGSEEWLKQGFKSIKEHSCPFCLRPFDETVEIIEAYKQYFNIEYNQLLASLEKICLEASVYNLDTQFLTIENVISTNNSSLDFWKQHLPNEPILTSLIGEKTTIVEDFKKVKELIKLKLENPIQGHNSSVISTFNSIVQIFNQNIETFNLDIDKYSQRITKLKASKQPNIQQLEIEMKQLKAVKKRNDPTISTLCTNLVTYIGGVQRLNTDKNKKKKLLDTHSTTIFTNYTTKINFYLRVFAPYLEIRGLDSAYIGSSKEPIIKYALHINGNEIKQDESITHPTFKYSLSEGDKSALALAFFLTKLEVDGNLQNKIIVFDDPVSSFDLNRKATTILKLLYFGQRAKQLFVLTHNIIFAGEFWKSANQLNCTSQCSKIEFVSNTSCIIEFHIDNETLSSVLKDSLAIKNYLSNGCYSDQERRSVARCLRPALESYFHLKFFDIVCANEWFGNFIDKVRNSTTADPFHRLVEQVQEMTDINDYSKKYHHRYNTNADSEQVSDAELRNYCQRTLKLIQLI